jgi:hypothetical protein
MYGKMTQFTDANGRKLWEFDRLQNTKTGEKATLIFRDYPNFPGVIGYALKDDGTFCTLPEFGFFEVVPNEEADQEFCAKYDYRRRAED